MSDVNEVVWAPHPGSQEKFLEARNIFEVLLHGSRGGGKTDALIMSFAAEVGRGYGHAWRGILFRRKAVDLRDIIAKTHKYFPRMFKGAQFNSNQATWRFPDGEELILAHMDGPQDYSKYHGQEYTWIGFEELTHWPDDEAYLKMFSTCRSTVPDIPFMVRATTNPSGPGHGWVRERFKLFGGNGTQLLKGLKTDDGTMLPSRASIFSHTSENQALQVNKVAYNNYIASLKASAGSSESDYKAWIEGSWDIVSGGMFSDVWDPDYNVVEPFDIPNSWTITRSFDWGSAKPFSIGWWAIANGEDYRDRSGNLHSSVRGDMFRINEWYGWTGKPNKGIHAMADELTIGIIEREIEWGWRTAHTAETRVKMGVADGQIFHGENGNGVAKDMQKSVRLLDGHSYPGIRWRPSDKSKGTRINGWNRMRQAMRNAHPPKIIDEEGNFKYNGIREYPGMFVFNNCIHGFLRTVPALPRDEKNNEDIDTETEDHTADECRYFVNAQRGGVTYGRVSGLV